jgi:hypothetical protein
MREPIHTPAEFTAAVRACLLDALHGGVNEIVCCDRDFADWPLNEPVLIEALTAWARPPRRLLLLANDYEPLRRRCPRFVQWRTTWAHCVEARAPEDGDQPPLPTILLAGRCSVELLDREHVRGRCSDDPFDARDARERLDAISQRSIPGFATTVLGL